MGSIPEKFIEQLPAPVFGAIAVILLISWVLKESKNFERIGQVFALKNFRLISASIIGSVTVYYAYVGYLGLFPPTEFSAHERGIAVFAIERDDNRAVQSQIYESIKLGLDYKQVPPDLRVKRTPRQLDEAHDDIAKYCRAINATVCTWGSLIPPNTVYMNAVLSSDPQLPARAQLPDYHQPSDFVSQLIQMASNSLPSGSGTAIATPYVQDKIKGLEKSQSQLMDQMLVLQTKLDALTAQIDEKAIFTEELSRRRLGIFVGISKYSRMPALRFPAADAASVMEATSGLWPKTEFQLLSDAEATRPSILRAMQKIADQASSEDQVWIYLAGHAVVENGETYFLPVDADPKNVAANGIPFSQIRTWFNNLKAKQGIAFIDTCYSGAFFDRLSRGVVEPTKWLAGMGRVVFAATAPNELAFEDVNVGHGLFTDALLDGLQHSPPTRFGVVTDDTLFSFINSKMAQYNARGVYQSPAMYSNLIGHLALAPGAVKR